MIALRTVASMLSTDKSEAEQLVAQQIDALREEHDGFRAGLRQQANDLGDLEEVVRSTLCEELGVVLPRRPTSLSMRATAGSPSASFDLTGVGDSKVVRLRRWFRSAMCRLWEVVYGKPEDS